MSENTEDKKVSLRIPVKLKQDLEKLAEKERRSLNQQMVVLLEDATKQHAAAA